MTQGPERRVGLVEYFYKWDTDNDQPLSQADLALVNATFAFDGSDANADGIVSLEEVKAYAAERLYRQIGLGEFFDLVDTDHNGEVSPAETEAAHVSGKLPCG